MSGSVGTQYNECMPFAVHSFSGVRWITLEIVTEAEGELTCVRARVSACVAVECTAGLWRVARVRSRLIDLTVALVARTLEWEHTRHPPRLCPLRTARLTSASTQAFQVRHDERVGGDVTAGAERVLENAHALMSAAMIDAKRAA